MIMNIFYKRKKQKRILQVKPGTQTSIHFLVINMDKNKDRLDILLPQLRNIKCSYTIVKGIDGNNMENDADAIKILSLPKNVENKLLGKTFHHLVTKETWTN